jgi:K+-sensing histidine kinase KdpD
MNVLSRVAIATALSLLACGIQYLLWDAIFAPYVWFLFFPTIFLSGWLAGSIGAVSSTIINSVLVQYVFVTPRFEFWPLGKHAALVTLSYAAMGVLLAWFSRSSPRRRRSPAQG